MCVVHVQVVCAATQAQETQANAPTPNHRGAQAVSYEIRKLVRNKRHLDAITRTELDNLRNRLEGSKRAPNYNDRTHVDVPSDLLERILVALEGMKP